MGGVWENALGWVGVIASDIHTDIINLARGVRNNLTDCVEGACTAKKRRVIGAMKKK